MVITINSANGDSITIEINSAAVVHTATEEYDPRASKPRCVHGKLFSESCDPCDDADLTGAITPGGVQQPVLPNIVGVSDHEMNGD